MVEGVSSQKKEMRLFISITLLFFATSLSSFAQQTLKGKHIEKIKVNEQEKKELHINYELKEVKGEGPFLKIRFYNKTRQHLTIDLVIGIYSNGVLVEKADVADCLKKSIFNNFFRPFHLVETAIKDNQDIEIKVLNIYTEQVDECRKTD